MFLGELSDLNEEAGCFKEDRHGGDVVICTECARSRVVVRTENPMRFAKAAKILRHGFEVVAIKAIDRESLARNAETRP